VTGTGLDVRQIVEVATDNDGSVAETAAYLEVDESIVESALTYYRAHRDEIDRWIRQARRTSAREERKCRAAREAST